jgi:hypothetical protein
VLRWDFIQLTQERVQAFGHAVMNIRFHKSGIYDIASAVKQRPCSMDFVNVRLISPGLLCNVNFGIDGHW